jgi:hypothetical protein
MKGIIVISLILLAGLASAYTPEQQTILDSMNLGFRLGMAYDKVTQGQNVTGYDALVDEYNAWVRQHFGEDANLLKSKINETSTTPIVVTPSDSGTAYLERPFNASSDLSKFGKQTVYVAGGESTQDQSVVSQQDESNFLT